MAIFPYWPILSQWIIDTMLATTALCALVLAVRRPVARHFGPGLAYALWLLPALRMVLPPLPAILPALLPGMSSLWVTPQPVGAQSFDVMVVAADAPAASATASGFEQWPLVLLITWLAGAVVHLGWQYRAHRRLLRALQGAETIDWVGRIRVVSSAAVSGPLSLGLLNPMIVLPDENRLMLDAAERDLAVAHELAHHVRGDLWANGAAVLFASLHWFNPVVLYAWRAFRFDQESACDAAVLAGADAPRRGAYARALAKAASGHPSAFAASMLGSDKLKERLTMLILPTPTIVRRRVGLALGGIALLGALGLTASTALADPAEVPPPTPAASADGALTIDRSREGNEEVTRIHDGAATTIVLRTDHVPDQAEIDRLVAQARASRAEATAMVGTMGGGDHADGHRVQTIVIRQTSNGTTEDAFPTPPGPPVPPAVPGEHRRVVIVRSNTAGGEAHSGDTHRTEHRIIVRHSGTQGNDAATPSCPAGSEPVVDVNETGGDGSNRATVRIFNCASANATPAARLAAIRRARNELAGANPAMVHDLGDVRVRALAVLDAQIAELERAAP